VAYFGEVNNELQCRYGMVLSTL